MQAVQPDVSDRRAATAALGIMGKSLDFLDACFAFYDQPSGVVALDWVEAGFLDMAVVCSTSFVAAAARGAKVTVVAVPFTDIESNALRSPSSPRWRSAPVRWRPRPPRACRR